MNYQYRILEHVELAQSPGSLWGFIKRWLDMNGIPSIKDEDQLRVMHSRLMLIDHKTEQERSLVFDIGLACGALDAVSRPVQSEWDAVVRLWRSIYTDTLEKKNGSGDVMRLKRVHAITGGVLVNVGHAPMLLIIPRRDGTYISVGFESVQLFGKNPLIQSNTNQLPMRREFLTGETIFENAEHHVNIA